MLSNNVAVNNQADSIDVTPVVFKLLSGPEPYRAAQQENAIQKKTFFFFIFGNYDKIESRGMQNAIIEKKKHPLTM